MHKIKYKYIFDFFELLNLIIYSKKRYTHFAYSVGLAKHHPAQYPFFPLVFPRKIIFYYILSVLFLLYNKNNKKIILNFFKTSFNKFSIYFIFSD